MARPIRVEFDGAIYHVTARGNERRKIFRGDEDREIFLETLAEAVERFGLKLKAYCLMPNHYHLIVETPTGKLSRGMGWMQTTYTIRFNRRHRRSGHLFQGRFKAHLVDADAYAKVLLPYVHLNPVRSAKKNEIIALAKKRQLEVFPWSSHRAYAGQEKAPSWLDMEWRHYWGNSSSRYSKAIASYFGKECVSPWDELRGGLVLGGERLWEKVGKLMKPKAGKDENRFKRISGGAQLARWIQAKISGMPKADLLGVWIRIKLGGERGIDVAKAYGYKDGSAVTHICSRLEERALSDPALALRMKSLKEEALSIFKS